MVHLYFSALLIPLFSECGFHPQVSGYSRVHMEVEQLEEERQGPLFMYVPLKEQGDLPRIPHRLPPELHWPNIPGTLCKGKCNFPCLDQSGLTSEHREKQMIIEENRQGLLRSVTEVFVCGLHPHRPASHVLAQPLDHRVIDGLEDM